MIRLTLALVLLLATGCTTIDLIKQPGTASLGEIKAAVKADVVLDLDAADAIAVAHGDELAHACYPVLKEFFGTATPAVEQVKGIISAFEMARVTRVGIEGALVGQAVPSKLKLACAPLLMDERLFLIRLGLLTGGALATGGALPALGGLGGLPLLLPK